MVKDIELAQARISLSYEKLVELGIAEEGVTDLADQEAFIENVIADFYYKIDEAYHGNASYRSLQMARASFLGMFIQGEDEETLTEFVSERSWLNTTHDRQAERIFEKYFHLTNKLKTLRQDVEPDEGTDEEVAEDSHGLAEAVVYNHPDIINDTEHGVETAEPIKPLTLPEKIELAKQEEADSILRLDNLILDLVKPEGISKETAETLMYVLELRPSNLPYTHEIRTILGKRLDRFGRYLLAKLADEPTKTKSNQEIFKDEQLQSGVNTIQALVSILKLPDKKNRLPLTIYLDNLSARFGTSHDKKRNLRKNTLDSVSVAITHAFKSTT